MTLTTATIELIIGAVLPPIIDLIVKYVKSSTWRYIVSLLVCLVIGFIISLGNLTITDVLGSGAIVFAAAQTIYKTYWKDSSARVSLYGKGINQ